VAYELRDLAEILRSYGRGVLFYANRWDRTGVLTLTHLGDTEGDIAFNPGAAVSGLTLPEVTGPAMHEADYEGENPTVEFPIYLADPALMSVLSPTGSAHAGHTARRAVVERTLVLFPEALFGADREVLAFAAGDWTLGGSPLTGAQLALLDASVWLWRGFFNRPSRRFLGGAGDARKNIESTTFQVMHAPAMPNGHHLYTTGDPFTVGIDLEGGP